MKLKKNKVFEDDGGGLWLAKEYSDKKTVREAILMARVTGSVGAVCSTQEYGKPLSNYADVNRIKLVKPS